RSRDARGSPARALRRARAPPHPRHRRRLAGDLSRGGRGRRRCRRRRGGGARAPEVTLDDALALEPYWEAVRALYAPYEAGLRAPTGRVYRHEIPGGQLSNLRHQAVAIGVGDRFE